MKTPTEHRNLIPLFQNLKWTPETIEQVIESIQHDAERSGYERGVLESSDIADRYANCPNPVPVARLTGTCIRKDILSLIDKTES